MDGVHDLGGMEGFGPLAIEPDEPPFHHDWEARVMALRLLMGFWRRWNIDAGRHSIENLPPADYLSMTYYEKWLASVANLSVGAGLLSREEVASGRPAPGAEKATPPVDAAAFLRFLPTGRPSEREVNAAPAFAVGDRVRTARHMHCGHTRLPRYCRDRVGEVVLHHGAHVFPDVSATLAGEAPQHLYTVRFSARELWGEAADPRHSVTADLWESYLAPAT
ncbi:MAG: nitrile hydratase subunit beta [Kiloniellales bacterium]|nr:nitrile hydratase subunit beta [Kiloniellales bacterium]